MNVRRIGFLFDFVARFIAAAALPRRDVFRHPRRGGLPFVWGSGQGAARGGSGAAALPAGLAVLAGRQPVAVLELPVKLGLVGKCRYSQISSTLRSV